MNLEDTFFLWVVVGGPMITGILSWLGGWKWPARWHMRQVEAMRGQNEELRAKIERLKAKGFGGQC